MSVNSNKTKKFKRLVLNSSKLSKLSSFEEKKNDFKTNSTSEKIIITKNKIVSFNGIEIIDVESYKKYNQMPIITLESIEKKCLQGYHECKCNII